MKHIEVEAESYELAAFDDSSGEYLDAGQKIIRSFFFKCAEEGIDFQILPVEVQREIKYKQPVSIDTINMSTILSKAVSGYSLLLAYKEGFDRLGSVLDALHFNLINSERSNLDKSVIIKSSHNPFCVSNAIELLAQYEYQGFVCFSHDAEIAYKIKFLTSFYHE